MMLGADYYKFDEEQTTLIAIEKVPMEKQKKYVLLDRVLRFTN